LMPLVHKFGLLMEVQISYIFLLQLFSSLSKNTSVFFFNIYFIFRPWNSVFHLFQSSEWLSNVIFIWFKEFFFPGFLFESFFWDFPYLF
jgi:hypothetical protein